MTMEIREMEMSALEERKAQIAVESEVEGADTDALLEEIRAINAEIEERKAMQAKREELRKAVEQGEGTIKEERKEEVKMADIEMRNTKAYIDAYADYIKSENDAECRKLLTENGTAGENDGVIPIPELVYDIVKNAWEKDDLMKFVKKTYIRGNLKVGFEVSSTGAVKHAEGADAPTEEKLIMGTINLIPANIKKWISVSDEVMDMRGEAFLRYIYDELAYQIAKKAKEELLDKIVACGTVSTTGGVGVPVITSTTLSIGLVAKALGQLSDQASNPVIVINKQTWSDIKEVAYANKYSVDPFEGLPVAFSNHIQPFSAASQGDTYMIVGDFGEGAIANFPNGEEIKFNFDDKTLATSDLVRIIGREFVAIEPVAPNAFVQVQA